MKITAIRATPVNIPLETPYYWSPGLYPGTSKVIVEVETDDGVTGLGESPSWDCAAVINRVLSSRLKGFDPLDLAACEQVCVPEARVVQNTDDSSVLKSWGGIEMALWDLKGKLWKQPLYHCSAAPCANKLRLPNTLPSAKKLAGSAARKRRKPWLITAPGCASNMARSILKAS